MLIGLNGFKGSGKDTAGSYLVENWGYEKLSFAEKLKKSAAALFGMNPELWEELKNDPLAKINLHSKEFYVSVPARLFLQRYGTEAHRDIFGADFWVDHALKGIDPNKDYVFTDARFENELEKIKELGGYNIRIIRGEDTTEDTHASEIAPPPHLIDFVVENNGSFDDLYDQLDDAIQIFNGEKYEEAYV